MFAVNHLVTVYMCSDKCNKFSKIMWYLCHLIAFQTCVIMTSVYFYLRVAISTQVLTIQSNLGTSDLPDCPNFGVLGFSGCLLGS